MKFSDTVFAPLLVAVTLLGGSVLAQSPAPAEAPPAFTLGGYIEGLYSTNFNDPSNGVTNFRGFDNRADTFSLSNVVLDANGQKGDVTAKLTLQAGITPNTYYLGEPAVAGTPGTGGSDATLWRNVQQAYIGYRAPVGKGLLFQGGLFLSPIGHENMPVKDNWNWSRSNLFFALPFYHTGLRASYDLSATVSATLGVFNGWNSIVDGNGGKSISAQVTFKGPHNLNGSVLYFGGPERPSGAAEGQPWRHLLDAWAIVDLDSTFSVAVHGDLGFERNAFGSSRWEAAALYGRARLAPRLWVALRGDVLWEQVPESDVGTASPIFFPARRVGSGTATLDFRPADNLSVRLELRHDRASSEIYFQHEVLGNGSLDSPFVANARTQTTLTLGATAWF